MDVQFGPFRLERQARRVLRQDGPLELSSRSFDILAVLLAKPNQIITKAELFDTVWPGLIVEENTLQVHVSALRKALGPEMIVTVHGRGYKYSGRQPLDGGTPPAFSANVRSRSPGGKPAIAVMPFANMSGDPAQEYFSDGLTEDIITELSRNRHLMVVARHSSFHFKENPLDIKELGAALDADFVVEGSVRKIGDQIRVTAQLVDTATAGHVWAERYDRPLKDVFAVQDELVRRLVSTIVGRVEKHNDSSAQTKVTRDLGAYDCWLRANHGSELWTREGNTASMRLLEEAISKDPGFARAHASLAFACLRQATMVPGAAEIPVLEEAALRSARLAVRLDGSDARAHNALGWALMYLRELDRAKAEFLLSAELNPNDASNCIDRALAWAVLGDQGAADDAAEVAAALNPIPTEFFLESRAIVHFMAKRHGDAEKYFALTSNTQPDTMTWRAANSACLGRDRDAAEFMKNAVGKLELRWSGPDPMSPTDFMNWFRHINMLRRDEDWRYLREAIMKAGFPG